MCIAPVTIWRDYASIEGQKSEIVPCGKCFECLRARQKAWAFRLKHQMQVADSASFITLTYGRVQEKGVHLFGDEPPTSFNGHQTLHRKHFQDFMKRLRKRNKGKIKYYMCGEYGTHNKRPHYHCIMYGVDQNWLRDSLRFAKEVWTHGMVDIAECNIQTIMYTCGYIMVGVWEPEQDDDDRAPHFAGMSKNLGLNYLSEAVWEYHVDNLIGHVTMPGGDLIPLPRYYRDRIFSKDERKELAEYTRAIHALDWSEFDKINFDLDIYHRREKVKLHERQQKLKRLKV